VKTELPLWWLFYFKGGGETYDYLNNKNQTTRIR